MKAAFLLRFAGYVEWPASIASQTEFTVGVVGDDAVLAALERLAVHQRVLGKPVRLQEPDLRRHRDPLAILYVGTAALGGASGPESPLHRPGTLVVTHDGRGLASGAAINFVVVDRRVRFEVSMTAVRRAGLSVNSALLSVATRVEDDRRGAVRCAVGPVSGRPGSHCERQLLAGGGAAEARMRPLPQRRRT